MSKNYQELLGRLSKALDVTHSTVPPKTMDVLHKMVQAKFPANTLLPMLPVHLGILREVWRKPTSVLSSMRLLDSLYRVQPTDASFLLSHPPATLVIVHSATKSKQTRHAAPLDQEVWKVESLARKLYAIATTQARINNYLAYFSAYALHLTNQISPLLASLPDVTQQKTAEELVLELAMVSTQQINSVHHSVSCTSRFLATSLRLRV